jgi:putative ABC transport system permease protein
MTFTIQGPDAAGKYEVMRQKLLQNPKVVSVGTASTTPGDGFGKALMNVETEDGRMEQYGVDNYAVDYDFIETLGVPIVAGRNFSREFSTDTTNAVIVNETMVKRFGWADPIGKKFQFPSDGGAPDTLPFLLVIGVIKDFHQESLYEPIPPLMLLPSRVNGQVHVRIQPDNAGDLTTTIGYVERQWNEAFPNIPFEFQFVDEAFYELYAADQVRARIFTLFSILMLLIACLGLLGLASFTSEQRGKEISVRRILGAKTSDIVVLLTRNYALLVSIATLPAFIAAWVFMNRWLETFAYHGEMNYWLYFVAFIAVLFIALATTGYHALKAVGADPVERLRNE